MTSRSPSKSRWGRRSLSSRRAATLVEVVAGLGLLATLLVGLLTAKARYTRQSAVAERRLQAAAAADALLSQWWQDLDHFPRSASGWVEGGRGVEDDPELQWRTQVIPNPDVEELGAHVIRLEVLDGRPGPTAEAVLVAVEVVVKDKEKEGASAATEGGDTLQGLYGR